MNLLLYGGSHELHPEDLNGIFVIEEFVLLIVSSNQIRLLVKVEHCKCCFYPSYPGNELPSAASLETLWQNQRSPRKQISSQKPQRIVFLLLAKSKVTCFSKSTKETSYFFAATGIQVHRDGAALVNICFSVSFGDDIRFPVTSFYPTLHEGLCYLIDVLSIGANNRIDSSHYASYMTYCKATGQNHPTLCATIQRNSIQQISISSKEPYIGCIRWSPAVNRNNKESLVIDNELIIRRCEELASNFFSPSPVTGFRRYHSLVGIVESISIAEDRTLVLRLTNADAVRGRNDKKGFSNLQQQRQVTVYLRDISPLQKLKMQGSFDFQTTDFFPDLIAGEIIEFSCMTPHHRDSMWYFSSTTATSWRLMDLPIANLNASCRSTQQIMVLWMDEMNHLPVMSQVLFQCNIIAVESIKFTIR